MPDLINKRIRGVYSEIESLTDGHISSYFTLNTHNCSSCNFTTVTTHRRIYAILKSMMQMISSCIRAVIYHLSTDSICVCVCVSTSGILLDNKKVKLHVFLSGSFNLIKHKSIHDVNRRSDVILYLFWAISCLLASDIPAMRNWFTRQLIVHPSSEVLCVSSGSIVSVWKQQPETWLPSAVFTRYCKPLIKHISLY